MVGCLDGTEVTIMKPKVDAEAFFKTGKRAMPSMCFLS